MGKILRLSEKEKGKSVIINFRLGRLEKAEKKGGKKVWVY